MKHRVTIEKIINGGKGLCRLDDGMIVMVPFVLPDETVEVLEKKRFSGHMEAELLQLLEPSLQRTSPVCRFYAICGGCDLQHGTYVMQQQIKEDILLESLRRAGVVCSEGVYQSLVASQWFLSYRYRVRMKFSFSGLGFTKVRSNTVVPIEFCPVATERINKALQNIHASWSKIKSLARSCSEIELLHSPADEKVIGLVHLQKNRKTDWQSLHALSRLDILDDLLIRNGKQILPVKREGRRQLLSQDFQENAYVPEYTLTWSAGCFSQVNALQNEKLSELVCQLCGPLKGKRVLDLYCGIGNFTVPLALCGAVGTGVEQNEQSLRWASANLNRAGIDMKQWDFFCGDAADILGRFQQETKGFDCIVCDPPRAGLGNVTCILLALEPERIVYVSCDTATFARDLKVFVSAGYRIDFLVPVDMFPQTHHIESVALLKKIDIGSSSH